MLCFEGKVDRKRARGGRSGCRILPVAFSNAVFQFFFTTVKPRTLLIGAPFVSVRGGYLSLYPYERI